MAKNKRKKSKKKPEEYNVGYGKPPKEHQWQKGCLSPNPKGRPKKIKTIKEALQICLDKEVNTRDENGTVKKISCLEALANRTIVDAISKDGPTRRMLYREDLLRLESKEQEIEKTQEEIDTKEIEERYGKLLLQWAKMPPHIREIHCKLIKATITEILDERHYGINPI